MSGLPTGFTVTVEWDPVGNAGVTADVSSYVRSGAITRGASRYDGSLPVHYSAGTCSLVLSNLDARFDPTNTSSPYWDATNGVTQLIPDRPKVQVRASTTTVSDSFSTDTVSGGKWSFLKGAAGNVDATTGVLKGVTPYTQEMLMKSLYTPTAWGDCSVQTKTFWPNATNANQYLGPAFKIIDANNFIDCWVYSDGTHAWLGIDVVVAGVITETLLQLPSIPNTQAIWVVGRIVGNVVTAQMWTSAPVIGGTPTASISTTLTGTAAATLGSGVTGGVGIEGIFAQSGSYVDDWSVSDVKSLFTGTADSWQCDYPASGKDAICTLSASDAIKTLSTIEIDMLPGGSGSNLSGQLAGARVGSILDWVGGFPDRSVDFAFPENGMGPVTDTFASAWQMLQDVADAELGEIWFNGAGTIVFRDRNSVYAATNRTVSQATFGDAGAELRYTGFSLATDDVQIYNDISLTSNDNVVGTASDSGSIAKFYDRKLSKTMLFQDVNATEGAGTAQRMAQFSLALLSTPDPRIDAIAFVPGADPTNLWPQALGRELGDRITVKCRPPGRAATPIVQDVWIRGVEHAFTADVWTTTFGLQGATRQAVLVFDSPTVGTFDTGRFGF